MHYRRECHISDAAGCRLPTAKPTLARQQSLCESDHRERPSDIGGICRPPLAWPGNNRLIVQEALYRLLFHRKSVLLVSMQRRELHPLERWSRNNSVGFDQWRGGMEILSQHHRHAENRNHQSTSVILGVASMKRLVILFLCGSAVAQVVAGYRLENTRVSAQEPIILSFFVSNNSAAVVKVDLGLNGTQGFLLSVTSPDGKRVTVRPTSASELDFLGMTSIEPGRRFTERLVLNKWFDFSQLGRYELRAMLTNPIRTEEGRDLLRTDEFAERVEVGPSNPQELSLVCERLTREASGTDSYESAVEAATALSVIHDPMVVPYLARLLDVDAPIQTTIVPALEHISNLEAATALAVALKSKSGLTVSLAQAALTRIATTSADPIVRTKAKEFLNRQ